jgi:CBS domain containing-hemolysin-like protein
MNEFLEAAPLWLPGLCAMACLALASAFFSASETALFYLSRDELRVLQVGRPRERIVATLLKDPERLLTAILFWNLVVNLTYFMVSVVTSRRLVEAEQTAAAGVLGVLAVAALIACGEVLPKGVAVVFRRQIAVLVGWPLALVVRLIDPVAPWLAGTTRVLRRTIWPNLRQEPYLDVTDLERAIESSDIGADLIRHEQQVLHNILDLSEITVEEVMRPRGTYTVCKGPVHLDQLRGKLPPAGYLLLRDDAPDTIRAAVPLNALAAVPEWNIDSAAEDVVHVPWCATLADTLEQMRDELAAVAVVVNELGETVGVVTYEDLVETILSPLPSRAKRVLHREPVVEVVPGRFHVDGLTTLRHLALRVGVDYEPTVDGLLTVAGLFHDTLERIPVVGDKCRWHGWEITVIDADKRGRVRVMASHLPATAAEPGRRP